MGFYLTHCNVHCFIHTQPTRYPTQNPTPDPTVSPVTPAPTPCEDRLWYFNGEKGTNYPTEDGSIPGEFDSKYRCCYAIFGPHVACPAEDLCNPIDITPEPTKKPTRYPTKNVSLLISYSHMHYGFLSDALQCSLLYPYPANSLPYQESDSRSHCFPRDAGTNALRGGPTVVLQRTQVL